MITQDALKTLIEEEFGFAPTADQGSAIRSFAAFLTDSDPQTVMILRGSAGTGKTSVAAALVRSMRRLRQKVVLLAPTGRAAKVFSLHAGSPASTIHRRIYQEKAYEGLGGAFNLRDNRSRDTLFIVDESSMIANQGYGDSAFGSGCLLDDLVRFVYQGDNCRLMLIGDAAQLPPVGEDESPALSRMMLGAYGLRVFEATLTEVLRQAQGSGILTNATVIRQMIDHDEVTQLPKIRFRTFADIQIVPGNELIETMASSYSEVGIDETQVITRSNKLAIRYNLGIRNTILDREEELTTGDWLMIVRNKYLKKSAATGRSGGSGSTEDAELSDAQTPSFIANGDRAIVRRVRNNIELYGFRFADVTLEFPDYDGYEMDDVVLLDTLTAEAPALSHEQSEALYQAVMNDYADIPAKRDRLMALKGDRYYNALQVKYAYAITCHKAQGGQWAHIYLDQGYMTDDHLTPDYLHWLYTAFTRATEKLFLVNWPKEQAEGDDS